MFSCVFVTFPYGVPGYVWYLIVSIPDLCLLLYFHSVCFIDKDLEHIFRKKNGLISIVRASPQGGLKIHCMPIDNLFKNLQNFAKIRAKLDIL